MHDAHTFAIGSPFHFQSESTLFTIVCAQTIPICEFRARNNTFLALKCNVMRNSGFAFATFLLQKIKISQRNEKKIILILENVLFDNFKMQ